MILNANSIFTVRVLNSPYAMLIASTDYREILKEAQELSNDLKKTVSIYCHGTDSIFSTITPDV